METFIDYIDNKFVTSINNYKKIYKIGKIDKNKVILAPEEVLYLLERKKVIVRAENTIINSKKEFLSKFANKIRYKLFLVFRKLRDLGYYVDVTEKGLLLVHMRGERNNPIYTVVPLYEYEILPWKDIISLLDLAKSNRTKLLLALIDAEFDIVFYEISLIRL